MACPKIKYPVNSLLFSFPFLLLLRSIPLISLQAILCADFILSMSSIMLARIGDEEVVEVLSLVLEDLVRGEFMQLGSRENENERFTHYLKKTFKKTASLIANACKAVRIFI